MLLIPALQRTRVSTEANLRASLDINEVGYCTDRHQFIIRLSSTTFELTPTNGIDGVNGTKVYTSSALPSTSLGANQDDLVIIGSGLIYSWNGTAWVSTGINIKGEVGPTGPAGASVTGPQGANGLNGQDGVTAGFKYSVSSDTITFKNSIGAITTNAPSVASIIVNKVDLDGTNAGAILYPMITPNSLLHYKSGSFESIYQVLTSEDLGSEVRYVVAFLGSSGGTLPSTVCYLMTTFSAETNYQITDYANFASFPSSGVNGRYYVDLTQNYLYRYDVATSTYVKLSEGSGIAKDGTTETTAQIPFAQGLSSDRGLRIAGGLYGPASPQIFLGDDTSVYIFRTPNNSFYLQNSDLYNPFSIYNSNVATDSSVATFGFSNTGIEVMQGGEVVPSYIKYKLNNPLAGGFDGHMFEGAGISITTPFADGSSIKIPNMSWIRPQTPQSGVYLTNGEDPTDLSSILKLTVNETILSNGDGAIKNGQVSIGANGVNIVHNEDGSSNSTISLSNTNATIYSGNNSNLALSASSATMYGGDSSLTLNDTYASLYQAGSGFYIDATGIKPQGISPGTVSTNGFVGLNSAGYLVKTPALSTTTAGVFTRIYLNPLDVVVDGTTYNTLTSDGAGATNETQSVSSNNTLETFATSFISDGYLTDGIIHAGGYTANIWVNTNNCNHEVDYYIDVYLTDTLGVNISLLGTLASGGLVLSDNNDHTIQLTAYTPADVPYVTGQRIKFVVKAIANTAGGGAHTLAIKYGLTHVSYIDIPVDITTDMVADTRNGDILTASLDNLIAKDGSIITTAPIPFAEGLSVASVFEVTNNGTINSQAPINVRTTFGDDLCLQLDQVGGEGYLISKNTTLDQNGLYFRFYGDIDLDFGTLVTDPKFKIKPKVQLPNIATGSVISGGFVGLDTNNILVKSGIAYSDISGVPSLEVYQLLSEKNAVSGYAGLDASGKINPSQLPALAITDTFVVASQSTMLDLSTAEVGDIAVRTDINKTFILKTTGYATLANWQELLAPTGSVSSVFGRSGAVTAQANDYTFAQIGSIPTTLGGYGITDAQPLDADLTAISALSADGLLRKTSGVWGMDSVVYVTQTALDLKANIASPTFTGTVSGITKDMVGLGNVDNTSDANKPVSTATQTALNLKANIASPTFTGDPKAPTPALGDNDTSLATTAFVRSAINSVTAVASTATLTVNSLTTTQANITAQAVALTIASPTGGVDGRKLIIRIKDDGTARGITWNAIFRAIGVILPATTVAGKILYVGAIYNSTETKWDVVSVAVQV